MKAGLEAAVSYVRNVTAENYDEARYLDACTEIVRNRAHLSSKVFIILPGSRRGNTDERWAEVKAGSTERCGCGNERMVLPLDLRETFQPSAREIVVSKDQKIDLKPVGGDKASTYVRLWIESKSLAFMADPHAPFVFSMSLFLQPAYSLAKLAEVLPKQTNSLVMTKTEGEKKVPVFAIKSVDVDNETATLILDEAVEVGDLDDNASSHNCAPD